MGEDEIPDSCDKEVNGPGLAAKGLYSRDSAFIGRTACWTVVLSALCLLMSGGCSLPHIIVLDDPLSPEEHLNLGVAYEKDGEWDGAVKEYEAASKRLPVAYTYLGNVYFQKGDWDKAEKNYMEAISKDPESADAYNNLAWLYYTKKEKLDEAEELAVKAIDIDPSKKDIYQDTLDKVRALKAETLKQVPGTN